MRRIYLFLIFVFGMQTAVMAQPKDFCDAINIILADAPNDYKNITGRMMESNLTATMWGSSIKIPGTIGYRIVQSMGLFYEGALIQTTNKEELMPVYLEYTKKLKECLVPQGYKLTFQENVTAGLSDLKKVVLMKDVKEYKEGDDIKDLPPHVTMEVNYSKAVGKFTIVIFIFQH